MAPTTENVSLKPEMVSNKDVEKENVKCENRTETIEELKNLKVQEKEPADEKGSEVVKDERAEEKGSASKEGDDLAENKKDEEKEETREEEAVVPVEIEPKTGVSFPVKLPDGKKLSCVGLRKKSMLGMGIKIYGFGIYTDNEKLKDLLKSKIGKVPAKPTKEMHQMVIDGDFGMTVRLAIVFSELTMNMVKKNFDDVLGASIKKLTGGKKDDALANKVMGQASDNIKLTPGSIIEISRLPGYVLQTKVMGEVVSKVESELLCRAYVNMYLGVDAFDKEAKEKFGISLLSLF